MRNLATVAVLLSLLTSCFQISWSYQPITVKDTDISCAGMPTIVEIGEVWTNLYKSKITVTPHNDHPIWVHTWVEFCWDVKPRYPHRTIVVKWDKTPRKIEPAFVLLGIIARPLSKESYVGVGQVPIGIGAELRGWDITEVEFQDASRIPVLDFRAVTNACPHDCFHCFTDKNPRTLNLPEILRVIDEAAEMGVHGINYLGEGEPTIDPWFKQIVAHTFQQGVVPIVFTDAATKLRDRDMVKWLYDHGATVCPKCDSLFNADYQNWVVRDKSRHYFSQRNEALELLMDEGFNNSADATTRLGFDMVVSKQNIHEVPATLRFCRDHNIWIVFAFHLPAGRSGGKNFGQELVPSCGQKATMRQAVAAIDAEYGFHHPIYSNFATHHCVERMQIYGDGRVSPCPGNETVIGRVQETSLVELHRQLLEQFPQHLPGCFTGHCLYREPTDTSCA